MGEGGGVGGGGGGRGQGVGEGEGVGVCGGQRGLQQRDEAQHVAEEARLEGEPRPAARLVAPRREG